jgi:hypothetical protein
MTGQLAEMITGKTPFADPSRYAATRFRPAGGAPRLRVDLREARGTERCYGAGGETSYQGVKK